MRQRRTGIRLRIIPSPGVAQRAAAHKSPRKKRPSRLKMATGTTTGTSPGNNVQPKNTMTGKRKLIWKPSWLESMTGSIGMCWTPVLLIRTWKKNAVLIRACTKPTWVQGGWRHVESSEARMWFLACDCDSCPRWPLSDAGCAEQ